MNLPCDVILQLRAFFIVNCLVSVLFFLCYFFVWFWGCYFQYHIRKDHIMDRLEIITFLDSFKIVKLYVLV